MDSKDRPVVIMDNGTGFSKIGFSGNVEPSFVFPTVVALNDSFSGPSSSPIIQPLSSPSSTTTHGKVSQAYTKRVMSDLDFYIGDEAMQAVRRGNYLINNPIKHGQIENWDAMERLWQQSIYKYLRCDPEDHYFLLTESPLSNPENREYMAEIMFETFNVPGLYIGVQAVLALTAGYAATSNPLTGVVVDSGDGSTFVVPVSDGYVVGSAIKTISIGGKEVTGFVQQLMRERGEAMPPEDSLEVARKVKENFGYTCSDIVKEFSKHDKDPGKYRKIWKGTNQKTGAEYTCDVGYERFLAPEVFFSPEILSSEVSTPLPAVVDSCIQSAPIDTRRALYKNIVLSGGSTMFKDFGRRLQRDIKKLVDHRISSGQKLKSDGEKSSDLEVNVVTHPMQKHAVWFGGSVLASSPQFFSRSHSKAEYEEKGPNICRSSPVLKGVF